MTTPVSVTSPVFVTANVSVQVSLLATIVLTPGDPVLKQSFASVMLGCSMTWQVACTAGRVPVLTPVVELMHAVVLSRDAPAKSTAVAKIVSVNGPHRAPPVPGGV